MTRRFINPTFALVILDFALVFGAFWLAAFLRFDLSIQAAVQYIGPIAPRAMIFGAAVFTGLLTVGLYRQRQRPRHWETIGRVVIGVTLGGLGSILLFYLVPALSSGRGVLAGGMVIASILLSIGRLCIMPLIDRNPAKKRVAILGAGDCAKKIGRLRRASDRRRFEVVGFIVLDDADRVSAERHGLAPTISAERLLDGMRIDEIVVAMDDRRGHLPDEILLELKTRGTPVTELITFLERETGRIDLDLLTPTWLIFADVEYTNLIFPGLKRLFDICVSAAILAAMSWIFPVVVLSIWLTEGRNTPIFYRQLRSGREGRPFELLKFRSMRVDAERGSGPQWAANDDQRVTPIGRLIRRFRIDELPQLINILRGEMSIVGPRPERPELVETLAAAIPMFRYRHSMRPGLTGWAQINFPYAKSLADARTKLSFDLYYIKNASIIFDILILFQTIEVVVWGKAISMAGSTKDVPEDRRAAPQARNVVHPNPAAEPGHR